MKKIFIYTFLALMFCNVGFAGKVENLGWKSKRVDLNFSCKASASPADFKDNMKLTEEASAQISKVLKNLDEKNKVRNFGFKKYSFRGKEILVVLNKLLGKEEYSKPYGAIDHLGEYEELLGGYRWIDIIDFNNDKIFLIRELMEFKSGGIELLEYWSKTNENLYEHFVHSLEDEYTNERDEEDLVGFLFLLQNKLIKLIDLKPEELEEHFVGYETPTQYLGNVFDKTDWPTNNYAKELSSFITFKCSKN